MPWCQLSLNYKADCPEKSTLPCLQEIDTDAQLEPFAAFLALSQRQRQGKVHGKVDFLRIQPYLIHCFINFNQVQVNVEHFYIILDKAMYKVWLNAQEIYFAMFTGN
jgi:hypothetical protein